MTYEFVLQISASEIVVLHTSKYYDDIDHAIDSVTCEEIDLIDAIRYDEPYAPEAFVSHPKANLKMYNALLPLRVATVDPERPDVKFSIDVTTYSLYVRNADTKETIEPAV